VTGCAPAAPGKLPGLQLQVCPRGRLCWGGSRLSRLGCTPAAAGRYPALPASLLRLRSRGLVGSARPVTAAGGCGKGLRAVAASSASQKMVVGRVCAAGPGRGSGDDYCCVSFK